jgi:polar amino acid transport system substrate-binding protein
MKKLTLILCALAALVGTAFTLVACSDGNTLSAIKKRGVIKMYTDPNWPPFEYIGKSGQIEGVEVDIANAIAGDIGVKLEIINAAFDGFPIALQKGQADMGLSGITITEERSETLDFSQPIANVVQYILKPAANTAINNLNDLAGLKIGVQVGTTGDIWVDDNIREGVLKGTGAELRQFKSVQEAILSMKKGDIGAIVCDSPIADNLAVVNPEFDTVSAARTDGSIENEEIGIAVKKDNAALLEAINISLQKFKVSGGLDRSFQYHLVNSAAE